jgi:hypothetical protein
MSRAWPSTAVCTTSVSCRRKRCEPGWSSSAPTGTSTATAGDLGLARPAPPVVLRRVDGGRVGRRSGVPQQVGRLDGAGHAAELELVGAELHLCAADAGRPVAAQRGQGAVLADGEAGADGGRQVGRLALGRRPRTQWRSWSPPSHRPPTVLGDIAQRGQPPGARVGCDVPHRPPDSTTARPCEGTGPSGRARRLVRVPVAVAAGAPAPPRACPRRASRSSAACSRSRRRCGRRSG